MPAAGGNFEDFRGVLREKHVQNALMNVFLVQKRLQNAPKISACGGHIIRIFEKTRNFRIIGIFEKTRNFRIIGIFWKNYKFSNYRDFLKKLEIFEL